MDKRVKGKLITALENHEDFFVEIWRKEWKEAERMTKKAEIVKNIKAGIGVATKSLLILIMLAGVISIATVAPNIFVAFGRTRKHRKFYDKKEFLQSVRYLKARGYVEKNSQSAKDRSVSITDLGKKFILGDSFRNLKVPRKSYWDGHWRLVLFDIPNSKKTARDAFRSRLKTLGLYQLQKSVFVFPDTCKKEVDFITCIYNISNYVTFAETSFISDDNYLREYFGVK